MTLSLLVTIALTTFGSLAWIVLLASVSALHDALTEYSGLNIADQLGLVWWIVWYQFLLLVTIAVLAALGALKEGATVLGNLLAAALALQAYFAQEASILVRYWKDFEQASIITYCVPTAAHALKEYTECTTVFCCTWRFHLVLKEAQGVGSTAMPRPG